MRLERKKKVAKEKIKIWIFFFCFHERVAKNRGGEIKGLLSFVFLFFDKQNTILSTSITKTMKMEKKKNMCISGNEWIWDWKWKRHSLWQQQPAHPPWITINQNKAKVEVLDDLSTVSFFPRKVFCAFFHYTLV